MLKFQTNDTTVAASFEDFFLVVYVIVDDLYQQHAPASVRFRRNIEKAGLSDSEVIAICICGELAGVDSEGAWHAFVRRNYSHLFPRIGSRSRFNRTRRNLMQTMEAIRQGMLSGFSFLPCRHFVADSFPLPVCRLGRACFSKSFRGYGADYGRCPSKKETFFGYRVHALVSLEGVIVSFEITPASVDDRNGLRDLADGISDIAVLCDKGYTGRAFCKEMQDRGVCILPLKKKNDPDNWSRQTRQLIFRLRRRVETVFSQLVEQLNAERVLAKGFRGLCTRMVGKVLAYNLCLLLNHLFHETCDMGRIKGLVF